MSHKVVFCIAASRDQVEEIVERVSEAGFARDAISVLFPDQASAREFMHGGKTRGSEGIVVGKGKQELPGGVLGSLEGIGLITIPGVGSVVAAGPIAAALGEGAAGGIAGTLAGMGFPETEAKRFEGRIKLGNSLISVHAEEQPQVVTAQEIFEEEDAEDIGAADETVYNDPGAKSRNSAYNN